MFQENPNSGTLKQVSYRKSFLRRHENVMSPLQPVDADMAIHAQMLDEAARDQQDRRHLPSDNSVER